MRNLLMAAVAVLSSGGVAMADEFNGTDN